MRESEILTRVVNMLNRLSHVRVFRNNVGQYKTSDGRVIRYGVVNPGGSDLIGWTSIQIRPEHVGRRFAIFTVIECKIIQGRLTTAQTNFITQVHAAGGIGGVARNEDDARSIIQQVNTL